MSDTPQKLCLGPCGRTLPLTEEYFHFYLQRRNGKMRSHSRCKGCNNLTNKESKERRKKESLNHASNGHSSVDPSINKLTLLKPGGTPDRCGSSDRCGSCGTERGNILGDIDETTGKGYGHLCMKCYRLVRDFQGDPERIRNVLKYVERTRKKKPTAVKS